MLGRQEATARAAEAIGFHKNGCFQPLWDLTCGAGTVDSLSKRLGQLVR